MGNNPFLFRNKNIQHWLQAANQIIRTLIGTDSSKIGMVENNVIDSNCCINILISYRPKSARSISGKFYSITYASSSF